MPSVPWRVEFSKIFKKIKKFSKFQKCPKSFPKVCKHVLNMFWGKLFEKFLPSFPWNVESSKIFKKNIFKIPKMPKSVPKCIQTCFRVIFSKKFYAQCSMEGRVFENFQIFFFKIPKMPKIVPESIQTCFERVLGQIFLKNFMPSVPWMVESSKIFLKIKKFSKFKNAQNRSQKSPNMFWTCFGANFRQIFAQFSMESRVFENFQKNISSKFQKCPKVFPKVSKRVLG